MALFSSYESKYRFISLERREGILQLAIHRNGGPATWSYLEGGLHDELGDCFYQVGHDPENRIVIFTGTGDRFLTEGEPAGLDAANVSPQFWDRLYREGKDLVNNLLGIEALIIGAVNGPALIHPELLTMSDIVIAADTASFADPHVAGGIVPGDGAHVWWPMLLGPNLGREFLLTGMKISAAEGKRLGFVSEVVPPAQLLPRAWAVAAEMASKPQIVLRYTRAALTHNIKRRMHDDLGFGLMLEGAASLDVNVPKK
jgi:enoyl-CoA hydratase/carnithine racemase